MPTLFAIGGGDIEDRETEPIDRAVLDATGVADPHVLFVPTASGDAEEYVETFEDYYGSELGCSTDCLAVADDRVDDATAAERNDTAGKDHSTAAEKVDAADAVYVGGGDTGFMLDTWRTRDIDALLHDAWCDGTVMAGLSAGALCWFAGGLSDAMALDDRAFGPVAGLDFVSDLHATVHATPERRGAFLDYLAVRDATGVALENAAAIEVRDGEWRVHTSSPNAFAFHLRAGGDERSVEPLAADGRYRSLEELR